jgi:hypothetical protein
MSPTIATTPGALAFAHFAIAAIARASRSTL